MDAAVMPPDGSADGASPIPHDGSPAGDGEGALEGGPSPGSDDAGSGGDGDDGPNDGGADSPWDAAVFPAPDGGSPFEDAGSPDGGGAPADAGAGFTPPPGAVGAPCSPSSPCTGDGAQCVTRVGFENVPNGYCVHRCPCGDGEVCGSGNLCRRACERDEDCRISEGYSCKSGACTSL